jgi:hypothetical protein
MGRRTSTRHYNSNGYSQTEDLPERGPGSIKLLTNLNKSSETFIFSDMWKHVANKVSRVLLILSHHEWKNYNFTIFMSILQWNPWSIGVMLRNQELCSELDFLYYSLCPCSHSSAFFHTFHYWHSLVPSRSESTRPSCLQYRRHQMAIHSSKS